MGPSHPENHEASFPDPVERLDVSDGCSREPRGAAVVGSSVERWVPDYVCTLYLYPNSAYCGALARLAHGGGPRRGLSAQGTGRSNDESRKNPVLIARLLRPPSRSGKV